MGKTGTTTYSITLRQEMANKTGREVMVMNIIGHLPGPVLSFDERDYVEFFPILIYNYLQ